VIDRLPRPHHQRRKEMLQEGEEVILIQDYEAYELKTIMMCTGITRQYSIKKKLKQTNR